MSEKKFHEFFLDIERDDIFAPTKEFYTFLETAKENSVYSYRRGLGNANQARVTMMQNGAAREMLMLASNNYLGLLDLDEVKEASIDAIRKYGYGAGSVPLLSGTNDLLLKLESTLAQFYKRSGSVVFPTGYSSNVGIISSLMKEGDLILMDMYAHASLSDGTKLTKSTVKLFKHNDMDHLRSLLTKLRHQYKAVLIITDGVFSMDGDLCKLPELIALKNEFRARLMIDEAHAIGVIGVDGRGTESHFGLDGQVDLIAGTLSKAPGSLGGYLVASKEMSEYVRHFANSYIFSTALPPAVVGGLIKVLELFKTRADLRKKLMDNAHYLLEQLRLYGFNVGESVTPIIPIILGDELIARYYTKRLDEEGFYVSPVVFPAVSKNQARLRISVMATHSQVDLDQFLKTLLQIRSELSE